jgi:hypothetical protein
MWERKVTQYCKKEDLVSKIFKNFKALSENNHQSSFRFGPIRVMALPLPILGKLGAPPPRPNDAKFMRRVSRELC